MIFDIDGVVCDSSERFKRLDLQALQRKDKRAFVKSMLSYNADYGSDTIIQKGVDLLRAFTKHYKPHKVFFITARNSGARDITLAWLKKNHLWKENHELIMSPQSPSDFSFKNMKRDWEWKKEMALEIMAKYDVLFAVDDCPNNITEYASIGIPALRFVAPNVGRLIVFENHEG